MTTYKTTLRDAQGNELLPKTVTSSVVSPDGLQTLDDLLDERVIDSEYVHTDNNFTTVLKSKLDGIENGATADQTAEEIKLAYESNADTNAFTDAEKVKLAFVENVDNHTSGVNNKVYTAAEQTKLATIAEGAEVNVDYSAGTNIAIVDNTIAVTGTIPSTNGGTGTSTVTTGDLLYGASANDWGKLPLGAARKSLVVNAAGTQLEWNSVALNTEAVSGSLPIANGGTGATTASAALSNLGAASEIFAIAMAIALS